MQMTVAVLAEKAGVSDQTIRRIESDNQRLTHEKTARKIVEALGLASVDDVKWPVGVGCPDGKPVIQNGSVSIEVHSLRWWRFQRGMTMAALAKKAGIWRNTVWTIENDYTGFSVNEHTARQLADALGLSDIHDIRWPHARRG